MSYYFYSDVANYYCRVSIEGQRLLLITGLWQGHTTNNNTAMNRPRAIL